MVRAYRQRTPDRHRRLVDHFAYDPFGAAGGATDSQFLILSVHHSATNNYLQLGEGLPHYRNRLTCTRRNVPWRPGRGFNSKETRILAPQTATVVGPAGPDSIHTDEYGRVRVQFHWDRVGIRDERSSAWVRVTTQWAGGELGAASIPRVGSEVLVQWLGGNPDRPIITGGVHNAHHMPPWELPGQQALMGLRSRELAPGGGNAAGGRSNHLILDDTNAGIQAQLKSDHACSQVSLGNIARIDDTRGRKEARGEGWEIATDAWGVARAAKGMLITTEPGQGGSKAVKEMSQASARLSAASEEQDAQAELAEHFGAHEKAGLQGDVAQAIHAQNSAIKGDGGRFPELAEPQLVLAGAAGIAMTSGKSTHIASTDHAALTTGKSLSLSAGHSLFANVRQAFRLFVHKAGMKLIAAAGDIDVKALNDSINLLAKLNITQTANKIVISAKEEVLISGAGSYVKFSAAGIEHGTDGEATVHAASHAAVGPQSIDVVQQKIFEEAVPRKYSQQVLVDTALWQLPDGARKVAYKFISEADTVLGSGTLDGEGKSARLFTDTAQAAIVELDVNMGKWLQLVTERHDDIDVAPTTAEIVFDYDDHEDDPVVASDDDEDDPDLSKYDITA
ncbi:type VI secretion system Vgr family protein [Pseudoduganella chitinolytica]|uniref:Type VI secretion system tip protein TssI/VgrG n=1 Tax=Pseudoduganella chitinolytica TaxID=34070 RepID=A0ABY8B750_9BURK|nr:type VI secretion system Vgr family protein [Pseudoduganella chitinolytica]WEF30831.1 type VI secretion system tip protein TssI/VgrG [Pseudoduganella chitinolytica]